MSTDGLGNAPFNIWDGVYESFQAALANANGPGFSGDTYLMRSLAVANECFESLNAGKPIPHFHKQRSNLLPPTVALLLGNNNNLGVLDFGGGLGIGYMTLIESIPNASGRLDYTIVEVPAVCKIGATVVGEAVTYLSAIPSSGVFDVVHAASSLQYVEHWQALVGGLASLAPKYFLLSDVFAGAINSFVTLQNYYESRIPHWVLNLDELLETFDQCGYRLAMKSYATSRRLKAEDILPTDNFPEPLRLHESLHLLFQKK